jgi:hypothetical protein
MPAREYALERDPVAMTFGWTVAAAVMIDDGKFGVPGKMEWKIGRYTSSERMMMLCLAARSITLESVGPGMMAPVGLFGLL